ncbi:MAG: hypothetical protein WC217_00965 [Candidatus Paceibacterota bacterium]
MKYATLDLGTIEAVFNKLGGLEGAKRFLSGTAEVVLKSILSLVNGKIASDAIKTFDPYVFYEVRDGLWIGDFFRDNVLAKAASVKNLPATTLKSFELTKNAYDRDITACLPQNYEFDISEALARIAQIIEQQPNGKEGDLLNNGYANLFYVPGYVVRVSWGADCRSWGVGAWERDDDGWSAGFRVFVRN